MNKKTLIIIVFVVIMIVIVGAFAITDKKDSEQFSKTPSPISAPLPVRESTETPPIQAPSAEELLAENKTSGAAAQNKNLTIEILEEGFMPAALNIVIGDTVTWVNKTNDASWPASDVHPSHARYPGSGIQKCGTNETTNIFDACKGLANGESWNFTFREQGSWRYHDHFAPGISGTITVSQ